MFCLKYKVHVLKKLNTNTVSAFFSNMTLSYLMDKIAKLQSCLQQETPFKGLNAKNTKKMDLTSNLGCKQNAISPNNI